MKTNYRLIKKWNIWAIITHWLLSSIDKSNSLKEIENMFNKLNISTITFDLFWHWKSDWTIENLTLTDCYNQINNMNLILKKNNIETKYLYWTSFSSLPILKYWLDNNFINSVFLKVPVLNFYEKRKNDLWGEEKMKEWELKWIIQTLINPKTNEPIYQKYDFMIDYLNNFANIIDNLNNKKIYIFAWIYDKWLPLNNFKNIISNKKNIFLKEFEEQHHFSTKSSKQISEFIFNLIKDFNEIYFK